MFIFIIISEKNRSIHTDSVLPYLKNEIPQNVARFTLDYLDGSFGRKIRGFYPRKFENPKILP